MLLSRLRPSWGHLGAVLDHLGLSWGLLGAKFGHLEPILDHLGAILAYLEATLPSRALKIKRSRRLLDRPDATYTVPGRSKVENVIKIVTEARDRVNYTTASTYLGGR